MLGPRFLTAAAREGGARMTLCASGGLPCGQGVRGFSSQRERPSSGWLGGDIVAPLLTGTPSRCYNITTPPARGRSFALQTAAHNPLAAWHPARGAEGHPGPALPSRCRRKAGTQHRMAARPRRRGSSGTRPPKPLPPKSGDPTSEGPPLPDPSHHRCWFSR